MRAHLIDGHEKVRELQRKSLAEADSSELVPDHGMKSPVHLNNAHEAAASNGPGV